MKQISTICFSLAATAILSACVQEASAQSGGFPAFSSEVKAPETTKRFSFPVAGTEEPSSENMKTTNGKTTSLNFKQLGVMLTQMGLKPFSVQNNYNFRYRAEFEEQEMILSFSAVLQKNGSAVRIRAWLDPLPKQGVPAEALLKMLSRNEEMNQGLRFAYSKQTNRFLLEKMIPVEKLTSQSLKQSFQEVSLGVTENWSVWSTSQWTKSPSREHRQAAPTQEVISDDRFELPIRR